MSGLSSMRRSPATRVLSLVRMTCSRKSQPKCFSTQAYWKNTHAQAQTQSRCQMLEKNPFNDYQSRRFHAINQQKAHLFIWAVFVMFNGAGANKDICAAERERNNKSSVETHGDSFTIPAAYATHTASVLCWKQVATVHMKSSNTSRVITFDRNVQYVMAI